MAALEMTGEELATLDTLEALEALAEPEEALAGPAVAEGPTVVMMEPVARQG